MALDLPVRHDDVLVTLLGKALALLPRDQAEAMAEEVGREYGRTMAAAMGEASDVQRSFRTALHAVADALSAHGFAAHAEQHGGELRIVSNHCPFGDAAIEHPVICAVDRGMVKGMLGELYGDAETLTEASRAEWRRGLHHRQSPADPPQTSGTTPKALATGCGRHRSAQPRETDRDRRWRADGDHGPFALARRWPDRRVRS
ncbi:MAG: hypothetical protein R2702_12115 [Acidimicrobiales bacterium]